MLEKKVYKNYKELCEGIGWNYSSGNTKIKQLKELDTLCKYKKNGKSYIITEIFEEKKEQLDSGLFINDIQTLILDMLARADNNTVSLTTKNLYKELELVNNNYVKHYDYNSKYSDISRKLKVNNLITKDVFYLVNKTNKRNTLKALNNLKNKCLILWELRLNVCKLNIEYNLDENEEIIQFDDGEYSINNIYREHRFATDNEKRKILSVEKQVMKNMGIKDKKVLDMNSEYKEIFKETVNNILENELGIEFYYYSYEITYNKDDVLEELHRVKKAEVSNRLNNNVLNSVYGQIDRIGNKTKDKYKNNIGQLPPDTSNIDKERNNNNYEKNAKKVAKNIIKRTKR